MATNIRDGYMSPQVWVAKREQKVIEILDRLVPARVEYAENIFARGKVPRKWNGQKGVCSFDYGYLRGEGN